MITLQIPRILQQYGDGKLELSLYGSTVRALLDELNREYPVLYRCICNETGSVRQHLNLFVNNVIVCDRNRLDAQLESGDVVAVFQAVSGG